MRDSIFKVFLSEGTEAKAAIVLLKVRLGGNPYEIAWQEFPDVIYAESDHLRPDSPTAITFGGQDSANAGCITVRGPRWEDAAVSHQLIAIQNHKMVRKRIESINVLIRAVLLDDKDLNAKTKDGGHFVTPQVFPGLNEVTKW
jgi:hypothetical protein